MAFVQTGGTVIEKRLDGERLRVDTGCLVAFTTGIDYDIERVGGLKSLVFGGEGLFMATLSGTGTVWLQSLPFSRMADRIYAAAPQGGGKAKGEVPRWAVSAASWMVIRSLSKDGDRREDVSA